MEKGETGMSKRKNFGQNGKSFGQNGKKVIIAPFLGVFALVNSFIIHYKGAHQLCNSGQDSKQNVRFYINKEYTDTGDAGFTPASPVHSHSYLVN